MITCNVCGTQNPEGTQYCEGCGVELSPSAPTPPAPAPTSDPAPAAPPAAPAETTPAPAETSAASAETPTAAPTVSEPPAPPPTPPMVSEASTPAPEVSETPAPAPTVSETPAPSSDTPSVTATQEMVPPAPGQPPAAFRPARLILKRFGALTKDEIPLQGERLVVGRFDASSGPVEIDLTGIPGAENISRRHAEMIFENNTWKVRDLGSTNGVFVKRAGQDAYSPRVVEPTVVNDGDELAFGNITMVFKDHA